MNELSPIFQPKTYQQKDISRPTGHGTETNNSILADGGLSSSSNTSIDWGKSLNFTKTGKA